MRQMAGNMNIKHLAMCPKFWIQINEGCVVVVNIWPKFSALAGHWKIRSGLGCFGWQSRTGPLDYRHPPGHQHQQCHRSWSLCQSRNDGEIKKISSKLERHNAEIHQSWKSAVWTFPVASGIVFARFLTVEYINTSSGFLFMTSYFLLLPLMTSEESYIWSKHTWP